MSITLETVCGPEYAEAASLILCDSWQPPAVRYTPEYMNWQLSCPSSMPSPAVIALDGNTPAGFCAITPRRFRAGAHTWDSGIVSFVAVRPQWRGLGLAMKLYSKVCEAITQLGAPIVTFGVEDSIGLKVLLQAYTSAGFQIMPLGNYPSYVCMARAEAPEQGDWVAELVDPASARNVLGEAPAEDLSAILSCPSELQFRHYFQDPRRRALLVVHHQTTGARGVAWLVETELITAAGPSSVTSLDMVHIPGYDASALPALFRTAAKWSGKGDRTLVTAPNLAGFTADSLRQYGIRQTGKGFVGYCCGPAIPALLNSVRTTNIEIV